MINEEKFAETYSHFDKETVVEIIDIFIEEYDERIEKITRQLKTKDFEELKKSAHAFKGVVANFETECVAYEEITSIMEETHNLFENNIIDEMTEDKKDELAADLMTKFESFKRHSRQLYNQLKQIRNNYID
jgi:HPt (histidine-containing phosphotransfer) domain-containing protein